jgi:signal transduction histidine kinase
VIAEVYSHFNFRGRQKGIDVILSEINPDLIVLVDYQRFRQVLYNVLGNAVKFTDKGSIRIWADINQYDLQTVWLKISDTGMGIAPDKIHLVFEQFRQADSTSTRVHGGTGLGMSISQSLMKLMNGTIDIQSEGLGSGCCVTISIPLATECSVVHGKDRSG